MATLAHFAHLTPDDVHPKAMSNLTEVEHSEPSSAVETKLESFFVLNTVRWSTPPLGIHYLALHV